MHHISSYIVCFPQGEEKWDEKKWHMAETCHRIYCISGEHSAPTALYITSAITTSAIITRYY